MGNGKEQKCAARWNGNRRDEVQGSVDAENEEEDLSGAESDYPDVPALAAGKRSLQGAFWDVVVQYGLLTLRKQL